MADRFFVEANSLETSVIFETNEVSFHGHPVPVRMHGTTTRKSLSIYYYTEGRIDISYLPNHTTVYF